MNKYRLQILKELLNYSKPIEIINKELSKFNWDYESEPFIIKQTHIINILNHYINRELSSKDVEDWANAIECREDLDYEKKSHKKCANIIYILSNPILEGELSYKIALDMINNLKKYYEIQN